MYEDYDLDNKLFKVVLSYKISKKKELPADTPPVIIGNNRQFQAFLGHMKKETARLCVEVKEKVNAQTTKESRIISDESHS